jgi:hypothetical protein
MPVFGDPNPFWIANMNKFGKARVRKAVGTWTSSWAFREAWMAWCTEHGIGASGGAMMGRNTFGRMLCRYVLPNGTMACLRGPAGRQQRGYLNVLVITKGLDKDRGIE